MNSSSSAENAAADDALQRLKNVIKDAGGPSEVSRRSRIPLGSLNHYLSGREMKVSSLVAIAEACHVSVDYLATGFEAKSDLSRLVLLQPEVIGAPAHFWGLFVLLRSCQEYHQQMGLKPTLEEVFEWIGPNYEKARALPDNRIEFKPPDETAP